MPTVGFRELAVDRRDGGFTFVVNGTPIFCRGVLWVPPDVVSLTAAPGELRASLELLRDAGMNMVRLGGYGTYESPEFWDLCDELGVMVWQDCMLASFDPPDDADFTRLVERELHQVFTLLQGRPALALVCGSSETYQQAAMYGRELGSWASPILEETIPAIVERALPGVPYIASSPIGGQLPFDPTVGVAHYFGVGAYERPLSDLRVAGVRFAAECLAFSNPPERRERRRDVREHHVCRALRGVESRRRARLRHLLGLRGRSRLLRAPPVRLRSPRRQVRRPRLGARPRTRRCPPS